jgi:hypothetical protein
MQTHNEPYVGPRPFEENDRAVFFGRGHEANELVSLITAHPVVLLYAQSGAGKTSLVKAGLIPLLVDEEEFDVLLPMRVREQAALGAAVAEVENIYMFNALMGATHCKDDPSGGKSDWNSLARMSLRDFLRERKEASADSGQASIVVFDQFEEFFTLYPEHWEERQRFFEQVRDALVADSRLRVLISMREDFIAELDPYSSCLPEKLRTRFRIERLTRRTGLLAVTQPLETLGGTNGRRSFAPGAAEELIDNLLMVKVKTPEGVKKVKGKHVEPLQLQVVCQTLWNNLQPGDELITHDHLEAFGDVDKALSVFYESAVQKTVQKTRIKAGVLRRWCEQKLITPAGTRGTVFRGDKDTAGLKNEAMDELERQSLIRMELRGGAQWYELTHDRFVEVIQESNQKWLLARPGAEQIFLRLEDKAREWDQNKGDSNLLDEVELLEAERSLKDSEAGELEPSKEFLSLVQESRKAISAKRQREAEQQSIIQEQARMAKVFRWLSFALAIVLLIAVGATVGAVILKRRADFQRDTAEKTLKELKDEKATNAANEVKIKFTTGQNEAMIQAEKLLTADKLGEAEKAFEGLIKNFPKQDPTYALLDLADICERTHRYPKAIDYYDRALEKWCHPVPLDKNQCFEIAKNAPADKDPFFKEHVAATLSKKGWVNLDWGQDEEDQKHQSNASKKYLYASGYFRQAAQLFKKGDPGSSEASDGLKKVAAANGRLAALQEPSPSP